MTKESHRLIREILEMPSLERIKSWLDTALAVGHPAWIRGWTRCSLEVPSNLTHSVGNLKELNTILSSLWSFSHFSILCKMFQSIFLLKILNYPWFCFLKATGKFVPVTQPELYLKITCFPAPATQNTKSSSGKEVTDQTCSLVNKIFRENNYSHILKSHYSAHYVRKIS